MCIGDDHNGGVAQTLSQSLTRGVAALSSGNILAKLLDINAPQNINSKYNIYEARTPDGVMPYYLLIPKDQLTKYKSIFNINELKQVTLQYAIDKQTAHANLKEKRFSKNILDALFVKNKISGADLSIYMIGHGRPTHVNIWANVKSLMEQNSALAQKLGIDISYMSNNQLIELSKSIEDNKEVNSDFKEDVRKYIKLQQQLRNQVAIAKEHAYVAALTISEYRECLDFFQKYINLKLLAVKTCYSGGLNSILPFLNDTNLAQQRYDFDIISESSEDKEVFLRVKIFRDLLLRKKLIPYPDRIFTIIDKLNSEIPLHAILEELEKELLRAPEHSIPIIRYKNQTDWSPLISSANFKDMQFYLITKVNLNILRAENKGLTFTKPTLISIDVPYVDIPITMNLSDYQTSRITTRNISDLYLEKLTLNFSGSKNIRSDLYIFLGNLFGSKAGTEQAAGTLSVPNLHIHEFSIGGHIFKNVQLQVDRITQKITIFAEDADGKKWEISYENNAVTSKETQDYKWNPPARPKGVDLKPIIDVLEKQKHKATAKPVAEPEKQKFDNNNTIRATKDGVIKYDMHPDLFKLEPLR